MVKKTFIRLLDAAVLSLALAGGLGAEGVKVEPCTWKECRKGALSISLDDAQISCLRPLQRNKFHATYLVSYSGIDEPEEKRDKRYRLLKKLHQAGSEIGGHSYSHPCSEVSAEDMHRECFRNLLYAHDKTQVPLNQIIIMSWPCGFVQHKALVAEYFLAARGYGINQLEDTTPKDFMNLKSFNSPEHNPPLGNPRLANAVYEAERKGKWAILVFHYTCNLHNVIDFVATRNLWVAPIGEVLKYILQRDSVRIRDNEASVSGVSFKISRPEARSTKIRRFETAFRPSDQVTFKIDVDDARSVRQVLVDGKESGYRPVVVGGDGHVLVNAFVPSKGETTIRIVYHDEPDPGGAADFPGEEELRGAEATPERRDAR